MNKENEIKENIEIFYSPYDDIIESIKMLEEIDLDSISPCVRTPLENYLSKASKELDSGNKNNKRWISLASTVCNNIKTLYS